MSYKITAITPPFLYLLVKGLERLTNFSSRRANAKKQGVPYLPWGFTDFYKDKVASGFVSGKTIYLAVWNLLGDGNFEIPIKEYSVKGAKIAYPQNSKEEVSTTLNSVKINLEKGSYSARFLEIEIN